MLAEVSKLLHTSKANKKIIVNARKTAKLAADKPAAAVEAPRTSSAPKKGGKKDADPAVPANAVLRKAGGSVWVMLKCSFDQELQRAKKAAREEQGKPVKEFVLPATNARYRKRVAKWESVAAADEEDEAPAAEEEAADEDDVVDAAPEEAEVAEEEEEAAPSRTDTLLAGYGTGASKCLVRTKSSAARKVKRKALPAPTNAHSADAKIRAKAETSERRRCRQRRVKQQKATSVLASQKVAANFTTQLIALLRKDVYPQMKRSPAAAADAATSHKDPNAAPASTSAGKGGKGAEQSQQQKSNSKGGKSGGKGKKK